MKKNIFIAFLLVVLTVIVAIFPYIKSDCDTCTGVHYLININNIENELIHDNQKLMKICDKCLEYSGVTILKKMSHEFEPQGLTMLYLLTESHFSIHTWPEKNQLRIDLYSCSDPLKCEKGTEYLRNEFKNADVQVEKIVR
jgi:S-adenosylmethionine decarboxylase